MGIWDGIKEKASNWNLTPSEKDKAIKDIENKKKAISNSASAEIMAVKAEPL